MQQRSLALAIHLAVCGAAGSAFAQPQFTNRIVATDANGAQSVFAADVDGDGDTDVLSASRYDDKIAWYENDGSGNFTLHTVATDANGAQSVFAADVDGDGDTDVLSASRYDDKIAWYENDGGGNFTLHTVATNADGARSVFAADVDGDGDTDVLSASRYDSKIAWYKNDGSENFTLHTVSTDALGARSVFAADVDGDGDTDLLSASYFDDKIAWYENQGSENFTLHTVATNADGASSVFAADIDGDGDTDLLSADIAWYENNGNQAFTLRTVATGANSATSVFAADLDGDGDTDLLSASTFLEFDGNPSYHKRIIWYENEGSQSFTLHTLARDELPPFAAGFSLFAADVDGDGDTDVLSASFGDDKIAWYENDARQAFAPFGPTATIASDADGALSVFAADVDGDGDTDPLLASYLDNTIAWYENDGNAGFTPHPLTTTAAGASAVFAVDVDGDGDTDVVSASWADHKIAWHENDGVMPTPGFGLHTVVTDAMNAASVFAADLDGDGDTDLLSGSFYDDKIAWHENLGGSPLVFAVHTVATNADGAFSVFAADVNGDGETDLLSGSFYDDKIAWYENDGGENFTLNTVATDADGAYSVFAADVDGDGDTDLLSASFFDDKIAWYENDGAMPTPGFTLHTVATDGDGARSVFASDVDGDGDNDVLSAFRDDGKVAWYENDGNEAFTLRTVATDAGGARAVFAADVDGDGDTDVLSASYADGKIAWYPNLTIHRSAAFDDARSVATNADGAFSVFAADVDGDGDTDLVSASVNDDRVAWYENDGTERFTLHTVATNADGAWSALAADLDGDGDTDLVSASFVDDKIAWYENDGSENFTQHTVATNADSARSVFAADVDRDGDTDLLSASLNDDKLAWYENDGDGAFTLHTVATDADGARSVFAADVDGDGNTDLVLASYFADTIAWFENDGNEAFTRHTIATNADSALSVFAADVDGDGDMDLMSASYLDDKIAWYENDGSQNFTQHPVATSADGALSVLAADLDGDGDTDLMSASRIDNKIAWYENDGSENFTLHTVATDAAAARSVFAVDLDGDGDTDLASASPDDDKIAWYENCGGQFLIGGTGAAPAIVVQGQTVELLTLDYLHNGRAGDADAVLESIAMRFTDGNGNSLNTAQANALIDQITVYLDDGDLSFDPGVDTAVGTLDRLSLTPVALTHGVQTVALDLNGGVQIATTGNARLFVEAPLAMDGGSGSPNQFQVTAQQTPLPRPQSSDAASAAVLSLECVLNANSGVVQLAIPVNLSVSAGSGDEATTDMITVTATTMNPVSGAETVDLAFSGSATLGSDHTMSDTQITIADGMIQGSVTFTIVDDAVLEGAETATLTLENPSAGLVLGATISQDIGIVDDDAASVGIAGATIVEDGGTASFAATLTGAVQGGFAVDFFTTDVTATAGQDYSSNSGTLNFAGANGEAQIVQVAITDDAALETNEIFFVNLASPTNGVTLGQAFSVGTITDNDAASVAIDDVLVDESDGTATFTATLTGAVQGGFSVNYETSDDTAVAGEDYSGDSGALNFAGNNGETEMIQVSITDDAEVEADETFNVTLSMPTSGVTLGQATGTGTITDNEPRPPVIFADSFEDPQP